MQRGSVRRKYRRVILSVLTLLCLPACRAPAQSLFSVDTALGYNGFFLRGEWTPLLVTVENLGATFLGEIRVAVESPDEPEPHRAHYFTAAELPRSSRKRYSFVLPLEDEYQSVSVSILQGEDTVVEREIDLAGRGLEERSVLSASRAVSLDFLNRLTINDRSVKLIYPRIDLLPDRWYAYGGVGAVVLHDAPLTDLSGEQMEALDGWVSSGGSLVIAGGAHLSSRAVEALSDLLPARVDGLAQIDGFPALIRRFGGEPEEDGVLIVSRCTPAQGTLVIGEPQTPLIVQRSRGNGTVTFLSFDFSRPPVYGWSGREAMWRFLLEPSRPAPVETAGSLLYAGGQAAVRSVRQTTEFTFPPFAAGLLLLAAYLGALVVVWRAFRKARYRRRLTGFALLILTAALFTAAAAGLLYTPLLAPQTLGVDVSVVQSAGDTGSSLVDRMLWLFSARETRQTALIRGPKVSLEAPGVQTTVIRENGSTVLDSLPIGTWRDQTIHLRAVVPVGMEGAARVIGSRLEVRAANTTGQPLRSCLFFHRGAAYYAGDLERGGSLSESFRLDRAVLPNEIESVLPEKRGKAGAAPEHAELQLRLLSLLQELSAGLGPRTVLLAGWMERPVFPVETGGASTRIRDLSLLLLRLAAEGEVHALR